MIRIEKEVLFQVLISFCFGMTGAFLVLATSRYYSPTIETVDIVGIEESFVKETAKQSLSEDDKRKQVDLFAKALNESLQDISKKQKIILVPNQAVLAGSRDATRDVVREMKKRMHP